ncbi:uncharacterized protein LOC108677739 [Hyalella azteca]|uniref:Uncharacterized protein LOC108677739 n=1 Tax=Hyalella azteca TaxID=294128 RepID=A0A8B7P615_HYAAZ|nr:uncharacterized protein LOC108677739 [Hyalella azteca]
MKPILRTLTTIAESCTHAQPGPDNDILWRRRFANDPDMMHELHRYRRLMLLTILPTIATDTEDNNSFHPHAHLHPYRGRATPTPPIEHKNSPTQHKSRKEVTYGDGSKDYLPSDIRGIVEKSIVDSEDNEAMHNYSFFAATEGSSELLSKSVGNLGSGGLAASNARKKIKSASSEGRLPTPGAGVVPHMDRNPNRGTNKSNRRVSVVPLNGDSSGNVNCLTESDTAELDLLTLAELYLESRHRVFGEEWNQRQSSQARASGSLITSGGLGGTGITQRPHRLTPMVKEPALHAPVLPKISHTKPAALVTGGLHLSVNYTNNLDIEASMILRDRAKALKPRIRRLNSLDDLTSAGGGDPGDPEGSLYRPSSAPDLANKQQTATDPEGDTDQSSDMDVTPARANTPTSAPKSSDQNRPPLIGASLATSLARLNSSRPNTMDSGRVKIMSPARNRITEPKDTLLLNHRSLPSSFKKKSVKVDAKQFTDLDILREAQAAAKATTFVKQGSYPIGAKTVQGSGASSSSLATRKPVAPIGVESSTYKESGRRQSTTSDAVQLLKGKDIPSVFSSINSRPLHHSLPSRLSTPLAPPPTALAEHGRKNSRVTLTPLDQRKISAP